MELDASLIDYAPSDTVERIDLAEYGSLANASEAGVAGASAEIFYLWRDERRPSPSPRCRCAGFSAGMAAAYDNHVEGPARRSLSATKGKPRATVDAHLAPSEAVAKCLRRLIVDIMRLPRALCRRIACMTVVVSCQEKIRSRNSCRATFWWSKFAGDWLADLCRLV